VTLRDLNKVLTDFAKSVQEAFIGVTLRDLNKVLSATREAIPRVFRDGILIARDAK